MNQVINAKSVIIIDLLYLGDLMFATPFIKNLRMNLPDKRIDMIVNSNFYDLIKTNPDLDNVYAYNKKWGLRQGISFARKLSQNNYDLGLNIHGNWRTAILLKLVNPVYSLGYGGKGRGIFLDQEIKRSEGMHMTEAYLAFLEEIGFKSLTDNIPQLSVSPEASQGIKAFLEGEGVIPGDRLVALNTGGTWPTKRWPIARFAELADALVNNYDVRPVLTGGKSDLGRVDEIVSLMASEPIVAAGRTSLEELAALMECCELVISNDSGPVHVADAVGTASITIFGPSDELKYRPSRKGSRIITAGLDCQPCGEHECPLHHHRCMTEIKVSDIIRIIDESGLL
ncbi:lipopolysaccharide heptosyltransferase [Iocasia frigidifontis]|uniref:Lipopolysaccharide heptosyltransferase n=1 Tax=Iocasia fonsfrigidae TaxID=2682810 RepID=A0A8A7KBU0_9FIRM|nr:glycosyltransferase family 9 protein [Iocasia fonsfrigidae]QTL96819.1 lipopolysaccharide heptosyltransferase [Iocasia fonsfrigidae]